MRRRPLAAMLALLSAALLLGGNALLDAGWGSALRSIADRVLPNPEIAPAPGTDVPPAIRSRADDCTARLHRRREALAAAGKSACKANAAVAREIGRAHV